MYNEAVNCATSRPVEELRPGGPLLSELLGKIRDVSQANEETAFGIHDNLFGPPTAKPVSDQAILCAEDALRQILESVNSTNQILCEIRSRL